MSYSGTALIRPPGTDQTGPLHAMLLAFLLGRQRHLPSDFRLDERIYYIYRNLRADNGCNAVHGGKSSL